MELLGTGSVRLGWREQYMGVLTMELEGVTYYFIDNEHYFSGYGPYGNDVVFEIEKYAFFCILTHHIIVVLLEFFSMNDIGGMLMRLVGCTLLTLVFIVIFELLGRKKRV